MNKNQVNQFSLLKQKRFAPFFLTQFFGAFNDNVFKNALIIIIAFSGSLVPKENIDTLTNLSAGLFILPFFLFSAIAGQLVDKYEKSVCIRWIKAFEIVVMLAAAVAFYLEAVYMLIAILFVMGAQSTMFGPAKYSYIPQHLSKHELIAGNALVQTGTFVAILVGTMVGGILVSVSENSMVISMFIVVIALLGFVSSLFIPHTPSLVSELKINWNPLAETINNITFIVRTRTVFVYVIGISWFWFFGATYLVQLPNYTKIALGGNEQVVTLLLALFTLGVGTGALLCNKISSGKIEMALVPLGSIGLTLFGLDLFFSQSLPANEQLAGASYFIQQTGNIRVMIDIACIGVFAGFYIVPLFALVQQKSDPEHLSRVIAGNNILNALFMVLSAVMAIVLLGNGISIAQLLLITTILNVVIAIVLFKSQPEFINRLFVWLKIRR